MGYHRLTVGNNFFCRTRLQLGCMNYTNCTTAYDFYANN